MKRVVENYFLNLNLECYVFNIEAGLNLINAQNHYV